jgi:uncharacterized phage-associated protein
MGRLRFRFNVAKFVNAVVYLAQACPGSTKMTICKQLYFADKEHLLKYGRPITGDTYYHLDHGQIPTRGLNMLRQRSNPAANALLEKYVTVIGNSVNPKRQADKKVFSKSDLEILAWVVRRYGNKTAAELRRLAHKEPTYVDSEEGCAIDFALFFKGRSESNAIKTLADQEQKSRDVLRRYAAAE